AATAARAPAQAAPAARGEPSEATRARLHAAVAHPGDPAARRPAPQPQPQPAPAPVAAGAPQGDRARFGINSLIHRMTGANQAEAGRAQPARGEPSLNARQDDPAEADRQREIPAFLRRQAN
ncbi:MAG: cell division protein FtsZ, partial [Rhodobacteraceae bacterium]|nr:cell division protein FtsZ [Paracoccaceae bacterium]